jgi:DNA recombination protein RmuC
MEFLIAGLALLLGGGMGWIVESHRANQRREAMRDELSGTQSELARFTAQAEERERAFASQGADRERAFAALIEDRERAFAEQRRFLQDSRKQVEDAFARLSQEALAKNSKSLLDQTQERLAPLREQLGKIEATAQALGKSTAQAYGGLEKHLQDLQQATATLRTSNEVLVTAFKGSMTARGRFGEIQLRNLVDTAGMLEHCDFIEQEALESGLRPDMIIKLPEGDGIPVDAKMTLSAYWEAAEITDPAARKDKLKEHAKLLRRQVKALSDRDYSEHIKGRIEYAVLFLPADPILAAAYEVAPEVFEEAVRLRVLIATPVTLIALLGTSKILWKQRAMAENAQEIQAAAGELYTRVVKYQSHVAKIGDALGRATQAYNDAGGSYKSRVLPSGRKLEELGGTAEVRERLDDMDEIEVVPHPPVREIQVRRVTAVEPHAPDATHGGESVEPSTEDVGRESA